MPIEIVFGACTVVDKLKSVVVDPAPAIPHRCVSPLARSSKPDRFDVAAEPSGGLSGLGKTAIAHALMDALAASGVSCEFIDGDELRRTISADLGFAEEDCAEQIRRAGELALEAIGRGAVAVVALISPVRSARDAVRTSHPPDGFLEVHVATPLDVCEARDPKGLYARARAGEIKRFTGIDSPYEAPVAPELVVDGTTSVDAAVDAVLSLLRDRSD